MLNIVFNVASVLISALISFVLTPYIVRKLGKEAHGFIGLSTNIISYVSLGAIAINTVSSRFVAIAYYAGDLRRANDLYTATFFGNIISLLALVIPSVMVILFIERLVNVPSNLLTDFKVLLALLLGNFGVSTIFNQWNIAPFINNLLFLTSFREVLSNLLRALTLTLLFTMFDARMYYMGIGAMLATLVATFYSGYFHKSLLPDVRLQRGTKVLKDVRTLVSSGIWNVINTGGVLLLNGLDLFLANSFLGAEEMGFISISKVIPMMLITLIGTLPSMFSPILTHLYAQGDKGGMFMRTSFANKLSSLIMGVPIYGFMLFSYDFYSLWLKGVNAQILAQLSFLTLFPMALLGGVNSVYLLFTVTNKLKVNAILVLVSGALSTIGVLIALNFSNLGMYAIVGIGAITIVARQLFYALPYAAKIIGQPKWAFYRDIKHILTVGAITLVVGLFARFSIGSTTWFFFSISVILTGGLSYWFSFIVLFNKSERKTGLDLFRINRVKGKEQ